MLKKKTSIIMMTLLFSGFVSTGVSFAQQDKGQQEKGMSAGTEESLSQAQDIQSVGVTGTMPCHDFITMISKDYKNSIGNYSPESNRPLQEHTSQMMELLQKYAVVDEHGKPLDYSWSFLVSKMGDYCQLHPMAQLNDSILFAGKAMFDVVKEAKAKMDADIKKDKEAVEENRELNTPPAGLPDKE